MHHRVQCAGLGVLIMVSGAFLTLVQDVSWFTQRAILMAVTIQPADVQPWMSLVNTALLTIGTTLIVLRQKWLKSVTDEQHDALLSENRDLRERIEALTCRIDTLRAQSCTVSACPQRVSLPRDKKDDGKSANS